MSRHERYGTRSLVYSKWHRFYLGDQEKMIDLDDVEYCHEPGCSKPLVLIEIARDIGQANKPTTVLRRLAEASSTLALCVLYTVAEDVDEQTGCRCEPRHEIPGCNHGITRFRIRRVWPSRSGGQSWIKMTPEQYRDRLRAVRTNHLAAEHIPWEAAG